MEVFTAGTRVVAGAPAGPARCPACGEGDLFVLRIARRTGQDGGAVYCAGSYDHDRRRFVRRGCGYAGDPRAGGGSS